jgi:hypothetical protein
VGLEERDKEGYRGVGLEERDIEEWGWRRGI